MKRQIHAYYSGRVQGVGFRFTAEDLARQLGVYGWAKNLRDGRVEIIAEAEEEALKKFLEEVNNTFKQYIRDAGVEWLPASGEFNTFTIKF
jgi:acylphosphatase